MAICFWIYKNMKMKRNLSYFLLMYSEHRAFRAIRPLMLHDVSFHKVNIDSPTSHLFSGWTRWVVYVESCMQYTYTALDVACATHCQKAPCSSSAGQYGTKICAWLSVGVRNPSQVSFIKPFSAPVHSSKASLPEVSRENILFSWFLLISL